MSTNEENIDTTEARSVQFVEHYFRLCKIQSDKSLEVYNNIFKIDNEIAKLFIEKNKIMQLYSAENIELETMKNDTLKQVKIEINEEINSEETEASNIEKISYEYDEDTNTFILKSKRTESSNI